MLPKNGYGNAYHNQIMSNGYGTSIINNIEGRFTTIELNTKNKLLLRRQMLGIDKYNDSINYLMRMEVSVCIILWIRDR
jgi:hypothetical protein